MHIRKHWKKFTLAVAALFWAGCESNPDYSVAPSNGENQANLSSQSDPASSESAIESSSDALESSSSSEATDPTSSGAQESSSSVNSEYPYVSGIHPSLRCKDSTAHHYSTCPRSEPVAKVVEDFENMPLEYGVEPVYGVIYPVCQDKDYDYSVFKCEDGSVYPDNSEFKVVDGVLTQYEFVHGEYVPAKEAFAKETEESEASAKYPYQLAQDTTVNCKAVVTTEIGKVSWAVGNYDQLQRKYTYKCTDGKEYKHDELRQTEEGNLYTHKETEN